MSTPRVDGVSPVFSSIDDDNIPYVAVRSQRNADASVSHVWEKWVAFSVEPLYLALFARWDPGMIVRHHGHYSPHTLVVLAGSFKCGDVELGPGNHIELPFGASFGPFVAGPWAKRIDRISCGSLSSEANCVVSPLLSMATSKPLPSPIGFWPWAGRRCCLKT